MNLRPLLILFVLVGAAACGGRRDEAVPRSEGWYSSPERVVQGLMRAYETRDDSLYASLLADEFRYFFEPPGADSADVLGWGKEEELIGTGNLFRTQEVERLSYVLQAGTPAPAPRNADWMVIPVAGGEMRVDVKDKEPMSVALNRQEIFVRRDPRDRNRWQIIEWRDYPAP
jgi:hypothetical protein